MCGFCRCAGDCKDRCATGRSGLQARHCEPTGTASWILAMQACRPAHVADGSPGHLWHRHQRVRPKISPTRPKNSRPVISRIPLHGNCQIAIGESNSDCFEYAIRPNRSQQPTLPRRRQYFHERLPVSRSQASRFQIICLSHLHHHCLLHRPQ